MDLLPGYGRIPVSMAITSLFGPQVAQSWQGLQERSIIVRGCASDLGKPGSFPA